MKKTTITLCIVGTLCALVALPIFIMTANAIHWLINEHPFVAIAIAVTAIVGICVAQARAERTKVAKVRHMTRNTNKQAA